jgi:hypothetical protein
MSSSSLSLKTTRVRVAHYSACAYIHTQFCTDAAQQILLGPIELTAQHDLSQPHVEAELLQALIDGDCIDELEFVVPLREVLDQSRHLVTLLVVFLLGGSGGTWYS